MKRNVNRVLGFGQKIGFSLVRRGRMIAESTGIFQTKPSMAFAGEFKALRGMVDGIKDAWRGVDAQQKSVLATFDTLIERAGEMKGVVFQGAGRSAIATGEELLQSVTNFGTDASERYTGGSPEKVDPIAKERKITYNVTINAGLGVDGASVGKSFVEYVKTTDDRGLASPDANK